MKKPYEITDLKECQDTCFYWQYQTLMLESINKFLIDVINNKEGGSFEFTEKFKDFILKNTYKRT